MKGTFTGKLSTIRKDGRTHIAPVWFVLEGDSTNIIFTTWRESVKGKNIRNNPKVSMCVDDQTPPFSFVILEGIAEIIDEPNGTFCDGQPELLQGTWREKCRNIRYKKQFERRTVIEN